MDGICRVGLARGGGAGVVTGVAIILARGGSKGVPRKNARAIAGRACVEWTIDHALEAKAVGLVALSTDDPELMELARGRGVEVVARPVELAGDTARVDDAARHAAVVLAQRGVCARGAPVVVLYGNVPVRPAGCIDRALEVLERTRAHSVQSYQLVGKFHPWWTARLDGSGNVTPWEGSVLNHGVFRRQDLPAAYVPDGAVMALAWAALMLEVGAPPGPHAFFGIERRGIVNPEGSVVDIDSEQDVLVAEAMLREGAA